MQKVKRWPRQAFTLIELLLVVGTIGILSGIVITAVNPLDQFAATRDAKRTHRKNQLQKAVNQYVVEFSEFPGDKSIPQGSDNALPICRNGVLDASCVNVDSLVPTFMSCIPYDGSESDVNLTGYTVHTQAGVAQVTSLYHGTGSSAAGGCTETPRPIAYWKLDETSLGQTVADASGNNRTGTFTNFAAPNGPSTDVPELKFSNQRSVHFDGTDDYIDVGTFDIIGNTLTLTAWFKPLAYNDDPRLISKATGTAEADHYWLMGIDDGTPNRLRFRLHAGGSAQTFAAGTTDTGRWTHLALVYDGSTMSIYKNGNFVSSTIKSGTIRTNDTVSVWIGDNPGSLVNEHNFTGYIDDVRVYEEALQPGHIYHLAQGHL